MYNAFRIEKKKDICAHKEGLRCLDIERLVA